MSSNNLKAEKASADMRVDLSSRLGVVEVGGDDAERFLQAQLSCDVARLGASAACYGAYLSPQGRVLATMYVVPSERGFQLLMHPSLIETVIARLRLYVLRDDVSLRAAPELRVSGGGNSDPNAGTPDLSSLEVVRDATGPTVRLPDGRRIRISPDEPGTQPADDWWRADLERGIASIEATTSDRHIAQALALDRIGAVSFDKGCFPGQEIVARVHYLGRAKRSLRLLRSSVVLAPGAELADAAGKRVGEVVNTGVGDDGFLALAVLSEGVDKVLAADGEPLTLVRSF